MNSIELLKEWKEEPYKEIYNIIKEPISPNYFDIENVDIKEYKIDDYRNILTIKFMKNNVDFEFILYKAEVNNIIQEYFNDVTIRVQNQKDRMDFAVIKSNEIIKIINYGNGSIKTDENIKVDFYAYK